MKTLSLLILLGILLSVLSSTAHAQSEPAAIYAEWVQAEKAMDLKKIKSLMAAKTKAKMEQEMKSAAQPELFAQMVQSFAPSSYTVTKTQISPDGQKASLFVDSVQKGFLVMDGQHPKKERVPGEVQLVKEDGSWKVSRECWGEGKCDAEPDWIVSSWGKINALPKNGTMTVTKGKTSEFKSIPVAGRPFVVDVVFNMPSSDFSMNYSVNISPSFAEFYLGQDEEKIVPKAMIDDFPALSNDDPKEKEPKILEQGTTYSHSRNFTGRGRIALLFDLPPDLKDAPGFKMTFTLDDKKYSYQIKLPRD